MPIRLTVEHYLAEQNRYWSTIYWSPAATLAAALAQGEDIVDAELPTLMSTAMITKVRADDNVPLTDNYATAVHNASGTRTNGGTDKAPFFVCSRVDFGPAEGGSPSRKYLRWTLEEASFSSIALSAAQITVLGVYGAAILAIGLCDVDGSLLVTAAPWPVPQMRQPNRKSKKPVTP